MAGSGSGNETMGVVDVEDKGSDQEDMRVLLYSSVSYGLCRIGNVSITTRTLTSRMLALQIAY